MDPDQAQWIPTRALPLDLQLEILQTTSPVCRRDVRSREPPLWHLLAAALVLAIALFHVLLYDAVVGFGSPWRVVFLAVGALLLARYLVTRRGLGFRAKAGQQMVLGTGSLVIADAHRARVIPAEAITFLLEEIRYQGKVIGTASGNRRGADWTDRLRAIVDRAQADPDVRRSDRFRQAVARVGSTPWLAVGWSPRVAQIIGAGVALSAVVCLEAGPLHARGARNHAMLIEATALAQLAEATIQGRDDEVVAAGKVMDRRVRESLLGSALDGKEDDARSFLRKYGPGDEGRQRVQARLRELCAARSPDQPSDTPKVRMLRVVQRGGCETPRGVLYFSTTGDADAEAARTFLKELAKSAWTATRDVQQTLEIAEAGTLAPAEPAGYPSVRLGMRRLPGKQWEIEVVPLGAQGAPVVGASYVFRGKVAPGRAP